MIKVCHLSSAHSGLDVRIFIKECASLAALGFETHLVINATTQDIQVAKDKRVCLYPLDAVQGRLSRMVRRAWQCYRISKSLKADVYHFHDPELIPYGILFSLTGAHVIYDAHEDVPQDILSKKWIPFPVRKIISYAVTVLEYIGARWFFNVIAATPTIAERFKGINPRTVDINNFSIIGELDAAIPWSDKKQEVCYIGGVGSIRGIRELVRTFEFLQTPCRLNLAGRFSEPAVEAEVKSYPGWKRVNELGFLDRAGVREVLGRSMAGLVTLHPVINYLDALPVKMFEYMASGIPVIASDFPLWREIVEGNDCGLCVDPLDPKAIAAAIDLIINNPVRAQQMGENGKRAVLEKYNWGVEEAKLLTFYHSVLES